MAEEVLPRRQTVAVIDDDQEVLDALSCFLEDAGWATVCFNNVEDFMRLVESGFRPDGIVSDVVMPGDGGIKLAERLAQLGKRIPLILFSGQGNIPMAVEALRKGATSFLEKPVDPKVLLAALIEASQSNNHGQHVSPTTLSPRQKQVMRLVCQGLSNKEIARELRISNRTVETYRATLMIKLRVANSAELMHYYLEHRGEID
jgi:FixJ family two-component response regulator